MEWRLAPVVKPIVSTWFLSFMMCLLQNLDNGMHTSPHLVEDVKLYEHFFFWDAFDDPPISLMPTLTLQLELNEQIFKLHLAFGVSLGVLPRGV